jgi:hypothetical protein
LDDDVDWRFLKELFFIGGLLVFISDCNTIGDAVGGCEVEIDGCEVGSSCDLDIFSNISAKSYLPKLLFGGNSPHFSKSTLA